MNKVKNILGSIALSLAAVAVLLMLGEVAVRCAYPLISNYDLEMWRYAARGKILSGDTLRSHTHRPGAFFRDLYGAEVRINSKGLRDHEYAYDKPENCYRVLVLGDSITFGWGVPADRTYSKYLERELNARPGDKGGGVSYQVINAGTGNYKTRDEVAFLKKEGLKYAPDMIILGYFINDAEVNPAVKLYRLKKHSYLYAFLWSRWNAIRTRMNPERKFTEYYNSLYAENTPTLDGLRKSIDELKEIAEKNRIPLLVVIIPDVHTLRDYPFEGIHQFVAGQFAGHPDIEVLDLLPYFDKDIDPAIYWVSSEDTHHNEKAHALMAEAIYPVVVRMVTEDTVSDK